MNRLILIGNGFDLAHCMKTSYSDFIISYLKECFRIAATKRKYEDDLISISIEIYNYNNFFFSNLKNTDDLIDFCFKKKELTDFIEGKAIRFNEIQNIAHPFSIEVKSDFLLHLIAKCSQFSWVAIENEFYGELVKLLSLKEEEVGERLNNLNKSMRTLIIHLEKYLLKQKPTDIVVNYRNIFTEKIRLSDMPKYSHDKKTNINPLRTMILNFNYTNTVEYYLRILSEEQSSKIEVNYIHGQLNNPDNPIVFGFGDEVDGYYNDIENAKNKGFFEFIKSFSYFKTENYHQLIKFVDSDKFQVFILGHSCGLSDRTMLKMIFEHDNCAAIKIFYHEDQTGKSFTNLTYEIARHFSNKFKMRERITPLPKCQKMPQLNLSVESGYM